MLACKNFTTEELACKGTGCCGGENKCQDELVEKLQQLRDEVGFPISISSAYRCEVHNRVIGGHPSSSHMEGLAIDALCSGQRALDLVAAAIPIFEGVGISQKSKSHNKRFVHLDIKKTGGKRMWSY